MTADYMAFSPLINGPSRSIIILALTLSDSLHCRADDAEWLHGPGLRCMEGGQEDPAGPALRQRDHAEGWRHHAFQVGPAASARPFDLQPLSMHYFNGGYCVLLFLTERLCHRVQLVCIFLPRSVRYPCVCRSLAAQLNIFNCRPDMRFF